MNLITVVDFIHEIPACSVRSLTPCRLFFTGMRWREANESGAILDYIRPMVLSFN